MSRRVHGVERRWRQFMGFGMAGWSVGQALWSYVADVYGTAVIPNILYMTRVSRNPDSGFMYVLGVSLRSLTTAQAP